MIPKLDTFTGMLPPGRWGATLAEFEKSFVSGKDPVRAKIWNDFGTALQLYKSIVPVSRAWLGGSFTTSKAQPGDIDVVFLVKSEHLVRAGRDPSNARMLEAFARSGLKSSVGLSVDSFTVSWLLDKTGGNTIATRYHQNRGYWDDFWERCRSGAKGAPAVESDAYQKRGYVEVIIDGNS